MVPLERLGLHPEKSHHDDPTHELCCLYRSLTIKRSLTYTLSTPTLPHVLYIKYNPHLPTLTLPQKVQSGMFAHQSKYTLAQFIYFVAISGIAVNYVF